MKTFDEQIISKRGTNLHATIIESGIEKSPLVLLIHGFKADRTEGGRFLTVAQELAKAGVNSICVSFPGCGDSEEPFEQYCMSHCLDDIDVIYQYMLEHYNIDQNHLGMIGYSMGGRLTCLYTSLHPEFKTIGLWAAASYDDFNGEENFQGSNIKEMMKEAEANGFAATVNSFDQSILRLSRQFFEDMFHLKPYEGILSYQGNVILCHGTKDDMVPFETSERVFQNLTTKGNRKFVVIENANHGFGLWDNHMEQSKQLTDSTIEFFKENL